MGTFWIFLSVTVNKCKELALACTLITGWRLKKFNPEYAPGKSPGAYDCIFRFYTMLDDVDDVAVVRKGTVVQDIIQCI